jgi:hypothetical protein
MDLLKIRGFFMTWPTKIFNIKVVIFYSFVFFVGLDLPCSGQVGAV